MMSTGVVIKVVIDHEIRRMTFHRLPTWRDLVDRISVTFTLEKESLSRLHYVDEGHILPLPHLNHLSDCYG